MSINNVRFIKNQGSLYKEDQINGLPNECPFCHQIITPHILCAAHKGEDTLQVFFSCPNNKCQNAFIGYYDFLRTLQEWHFNGTLTKGDIVECQFSNEIKELSETFVCIYNEAYFAEQEKLFEICGVGYRKALEFLIKDYSVKKNPNDEEKIKRMPLAQCIEKYIDNPKIKSAAQRAVWLGNDETHYIRKWADKDLSDLKDLIKAAVFYIEMEKSLEVFEQDMTK